MEDYIKQKIIQFNRKTGTVYEDKYFLHCDEKS